MNARLMLAVAVALTFAAACKPQTSNTVRIYNWSDYVGETTLADFTAQTGIKTQYDVYSENETLDAKLQLGKTGYDIVVPTAQPWFSQQVAKGIFLKLDKAKIPNLANLDPILMSLVAVADPGNQHGVIYQWGTNGIGYNKKMVEERIKDAPVDSWDLLFKPEHAAKLADCGIMTLDSAAENFPIALNYLGLDPNSQREEDLAAAENLLMGIRPYIRKFHSSEYINALANGDVCLVMGFSGDIIQAATRAAEAQSGHEIKYVIPNEGSMVWFDVMAIPADAPNPDAAHAYINFILDPKVMAGISNYVAYANAVPASLPMIDEAIRDNPMTFPPPELREKLFVVRAAPEAYERARSAAWSRVRAGS